MRGSAGSILGPLLFLLYFNDFEHHLHHSKVLQFADDTVIYFAGKYKSDIENKLNGDLENMCMYFRKNQLVINLKKGKTESMIFGTSQKLSKCGKELNLSFNGTEIIQTDHYKYLGTVLDTTLSLKDNFDTVYKRSMSKLRILLSLSKYLTNVAKVKVYKGMIMPCLTFNCTVNLNFTNTQEKRLTSLDRLAAKVLGKEQTPTKNEILKHAVLLVRKCLDNEACELFHDYFQKMNHNKATRNNKISLRIPNVRLKFAKSGFYCLGSSIYNSLPREIRDKDNFKDFRRSILIFL